MRYKMSSPWSIDTQELRSILESNPKSITLVDVREEDEFKEGHIEGALFIPLSNFLPLATEKLNKSDQVVLYCAHGVRSLEALMLLKGAGYPLVKSLDGGYFDYIG